MPQRAHRVHGVTLPLLCMLMLSGCGGGSKTATPAGANLGERPAARPAPVRLGEELVTNGDFSQPQPGDETLAAGWARFQGTSRTILRVKSGGSMVLQVRNDGRRKLWQEAIQRLNRVAPGHKYQVAVEAQVKGAVPGFVSVIEERKGKPTTNLGRLKITERKWTRRTFDFQTATQTLGVVSILLGPEQPGNEDGVAEFRLVSVREVLP